MKLPFIVLFCLPLLTRKALARLEPIDFSLNLPIDPLPKHKSFLHQTATDPFLGLKSKSGYVSVGKKGGQIFYWYIPSDQTGKETTDGSKPVAIWLTGGPGCSSELAALTENGPLTVQPDSTVVKNPYSWHQLADMIYVDQPLGTGFSTVGDPCNYATDEHTIAEDMLEFLVKLITILPEVKHKPWYITGESYAGHYIPAIAHKLMKYPIEGVNLVGIAIGNGWVDPVLQYPAYAAYAYDHQLIGKVAYQFATKALEECVTLIKNKQLIWATIHCNAVVASIIGKKNVYDIRLDCEMPPACYNDTRLTTFLNKPEVQAKFGVHKTWEECDTKVHTFLLGDFDTETRSKVSDLVQKGYKVLVYSGDQDFICNWMGGEAWTSQVEWQKQHEFAQQAYQPWLVQGKLGGEYKHVDNFAFLKIFNAGHMVPMDQPLSAITMLSDFLFSQVLEKKTTQYVNYPRAVIA